MDHHKRIFIQIIEMMEDRNWEYEVTFTHIQAVIGNTFYKVAKDDLNELFALKDEIENW